MRSLCRETNIHYSKVCLLFKTMPARRMLGYRQLLDESPLPERSETNIIAKQEL